MYSSRERIMMEVIDRKITAEEALLLATGRVTFSSNSSETVKSIITNNNINWYNFLRLAAYHKTLALSYKNIKSICNEIHLPKYFEDLVHYLIYCTSIRNKANQEQITQIQDACKTRHITILPVKGAYLIPLIYKDFGIRYSGDIDFLVKYEDTKRIKEVLYELGYNKGCYNPGTKSIEKISRAEDIKWKTYMSNLYPYVKLSGIDIFPYYKLDFRYALDDTLNKEPINEIVNSTIENGFTKASHYLIHLCTHFYDEAKHTVSIAAFKDLNLIKLCDIREFIIAHVTNDDFKQAIAFSIKYKLENALYYTMYYLKMIYCDGYEDDILNSLNIADTSFLTLFGENTRNEKYIFSKTFWERFFSCGNYDELKELPKHFISLD